ncbi:menaquinone via futalosine step 1, partial [Campylobacter coli]|nr:menaquinone via futalosine step 1 [Campylobacter coli]
RYYLDEIIYYKISTKEKAALKRFIKACKALNLT